MRGPSSNSPREQDPTPDKVQGCGRASRGVRFSKPSRDMRSRLADDPIVLVDDVVPDSSDDNDDAAAAARLAGRSTPVPNERGRLRSPAGEGAGTPSPILSQRSEQAPASDRSVSLAADWQPPRTPDRAGHLEVDERGLKR